MTTSRPTVVDVARRAGVSFKTVSRVINGVPTVDAGMATRVLAAVEELGFRRNDMARLLRSTQSRSASIGLVIEDIANPFYSSIAAGAADTAGKHRALLLTASSEGDPDRERELLLMMCERRVDGLLLVPSAYHQDYLKAEIAMGTPVVCLDRRASGLRVDSVVVDNRRGAQLAVETLMTRGHRRIGMLAESLAISTMHDRVQAALAAMEAAGLGIDETLVRADLHVPDATASAINEMLAAANPPTAFVSMNNRNTIGAIQELERLGSDAEIVGFDDFEASHISPRSLTIVGFDTREIGRRGADLLFRRIGGYTGRSRHMVVPVALEHYGPVR